MSSAGSNPPVPADRGPPRRATPTGRDPRRYATGQLLAFAVVGLLALPLLPLIALVVGWLRHRDRRHR